MSIAYLFPGQGSQHVGMGFDVYTHEPTSRAVFDLADALLGFSLSALCFEGPEEQLTDTYNQQPALLVTSISLWKAMLQAGWDEPTYVAGHSLGEFSALVAAGALSLADGIKLVRRRGELMKSADQDAPGGMAAVLGLQTPQVADICTEAQEKTGAIVQVANDNCPGQLVISGAEEALAEAMSLAQERGARKVVRLPISIASHSPLMATAAERFGRDVDAVEIRPPRMPVIANTTAMPLTTPAEIRAELKAQLTGPVRWTESIHYLQAQGVARFIEVGPDTVLTKLMRRIDRTAQRDSFTYSPVTT